MLLRDIHSKLIDQYDCKEVCAPSPSQVNGGAGARLSSQDGVSQQQETVILSLPKFNRLIEASFVWDESSASNVDVTVIPSHHRVTQQILSHWYPFQDLKLMFAGSRRAEQLSLHSQQRIEATVEDLASVQLTDDAGQLRIYTATGRILFWQGLGSVWTSDFDSVRSCFGLSKPNRYWG
jgi:hypothetical protein